MAQDSITYYVWIGGSCDYWHKEPTHEGRAETKLVWALPCKKEEDESQRAGGAAVVIEHDGSIIRRDVISDVHTTEFRMMPFFGQNEQSTCIVARTIMYLCNIILSVPRRRFTMIFAFKREIVCTFKLANNVKSTMKKKLFRHKWVILQIKGLPLQLITYYH